MSVSREKEGHLLISAYSFESLHTCLVSVVELGTEDKTVSMSDSVPFRFH